MCSLKHDIKVMRILESHIGNDREFVKEIVSNIILDLNVSF